MAESYPIISGIANYRLPNWGRCFWQDPTEGKLFLAFASGDTEVDYVTSSDGYSWSAPSFLFPVDNFSTHTNFDILMDRQGHVHCGFRYQNLNSYRFVGKVSGGLWTHASGGGIFGYQMAGDSGNVKGFQGSSTMFEGNVGTLPGGNGAFPQLFIASKASGSPAGARDTIEVYRVERPYNAAPILWTTPSGACGVNGGYPSIGTANANLPGLIFLNDSGNITVDGIALHTVEHWNYSSVFSIDSVFTPNANRSNRLMENMAIGSGVGPGPLVIVASNSGQDGYGIVRTSSGTPTTRSMGHLTSIAKPSLSWHNRYSTGLFGVTPSGTNCDFSHNDLGQQIVYFHHYAQHGQHSVQRLVGEYAYNATSYGASGVYVWGVVTSPASGVIITSEVDRYNAGGNNLRANWIRMKALKHPTEPGIGAVKKEMVITTSIPPVYPTGILISVHDIKNSVAVTSPYTQPTFNVNMCRTPMFSGVPSSNGLTGTIGNLFDGSSSTSVTLAAGGGNLQLNFLDKIHFDKIEIWKNSTFLNWGTMSVSGSIDGSTWHEFFRSTDSAILQVVGVISANRNITDPNYNNYLLDEFINSTMVAKYLRFSWSGSSSITLSELMVFSPGTLRYSRTHSDYSPVSPENVVYNRAFQTSGIYIEEFKALQDERPATWRASGNFPWSVDASGHWRHKSGLPNQTTVGDTVTGGTWAGNTHGLMDSFSIRAKPTGPGTGVLEKNISLYREERFVPSGGAKRILSFYYRMDMHDGDLFTFSTGLAPGPFLTLLSASGVADWQVWDRTIQTAAFDKEQDYTLRWTYIRGTGTTGSRLGTAWVDRVAGLDSPPYPSIRGFTVSSSESASSSIHGYMRGNAWTAIHGYARATGQAQSIWGYTKSQVFPDIISSVNGYLLGASYSSINGCLLGSSGNDIYTIPTSSIHGYIGGATGVGISSINGFVMPMRNEFIHGYVSGPGPTGYSSINGFVLALETSAINGFVQGFRPGQIIYGVMPDTYDAVSGSIHGYILAYNSSSIHGYVSNSGSTSRIHGYTVADDNFQYIHGYVNGPPGSLAHIYGYTQSANFGSGTVHGYVRGGKASGVIYGYASGVGYRDSDVNGYLMGISGTISSSVHGFVPGEDFTTSTINGFLIGLFASGIDVCSSHQYPLPPVDSGVMPSSWQCNMVA